MSGEVPDPMAVHRDEVSGGPEMISQRLPAMAGQHTASTPEAISRIRDFAQALLAGLGKEQKAIPCRFLYDARGSELFEQITRLPEYYPTRTEVEILKEVSSKFLRTDEEDVALVEFGSGSSTKTEIVLQELIPRVSTYVAIDISPTALMDALQRIGTRFSSVETRGIAENFHQQATLPDDLHLQPKLGFFPGSTIGNCTPDEARNLLDNMRDTLGAEARLIVGTDLVKPESVLIPAYDDAAGVTAEFSLNVLRRANRELGACFDLNQFQHEARWNSELQRIEIYLVCKSDQEVYVCGVPFEFSTGERIHVENSHKYTVDGFQQFAREAGWEVENSWTDKQQWFAIHELVN